MNGWFKLHREEFEQLSELTDPEFRYFVTARMFAIWDHRNKLVGTFDARTARVKRDILPSWSTGKINMTKNALMDRGRLERTADPRLLRIVLFSDVRRDARAFEAKIQAPEISVQQDELSDQQIESKMADIREKLSKKGIIIRPQ